MTKQSLTAVLLAACGAVLLLTPAGAAVGTIAQQALGDPPAPTAGPGEPSPAIPWLTDDQKVQAAQILASDPRTKAIFRGASYSVVDVGPWTTHDQKGIGAIMIIRLNAPKSFPVVDWPAMQNDWTRPFPHYRERTLPASATDVSNFDVLVDLNRARLVSLRPSNAEKMRIAPGMAPWQADSGD